MAWNEPGKDQDPWGGNNKSDGPPDLDQIWQRLRARLSKSGKGGGNGNNGGGSGGAGPSPKLLLLVIPVIAIIWLLTGFFIVQPGAQGVLLRFGSYTKNVAPGLHWYWPTPVGRVISVDTQRVRSASTRGVILTKDESLAEIQVSLQYRVKDPMDYLFVLTNPDRTVEQVLKSAVREVVNTSGLNQVIQEGLSPEELDDAALQNVDLKESEGKTTGNNPMATIPDKLKAAIRKQKQAYPKITNRSRAMLPQNVTEIAQSTLDNYKAGVHIIAINVSYAQPPEAVQGAFEEAIKAREAKERKKNLARAYARQILAETKGQKARILAQAKGYEAQKVQQAKGDVSRFMKVAKEYQLAPEVTHRRLYLETMGEVLANSRLVLAEQDKQGGQGPIMYLPLPGMEQGTKQSSGSSASSQDTTGQSADQAKHSSDNSTGMTTQSGSNGNLNNLRSRDRNR